MCVDVLYFYAKCCVFVRYVCTLGVCVYVVSIYAECVCLCGMCWFARRSYCDTFPLGVCAYYTFALGVFGMWEGRWFAQRSYCDTLPLGVRVYYTFILGVCVCLVCVRGAGSRGGAIALHSLCVCV